MSPSVNLYVSDSLSLLEMLIIRVGCSVVTGAFIVSCTKCTVGPFPLSFYYPEKNRLSPPSPKDSRSPSRSSSSILSSGSYILDITLSS